MKFIQSVRDDEALRQRVQQMGDSATIEQLAALGREYGHDFQTDDLRAAHSRDWSMRLLRYGNGAQPA